QVVAPGLAEDEGGAGDELSAAGKQDDVLEEFERAGAAAILVVDFSVNVVGVAEVDEFGAGLEEAIVPAVQAHARGDADAGRRGFLQDEQHERAGEEMETLFAEGTFDRTAEGHELRFDARELRNGTHGVEHLVE